MTFLGRAIRNRKPLTTNGRRIYAIGDVHGCFELLIDLLMRIKRDNDARPSAETLIVMLGDYIDRGPQSRQVCELLSRITISRAFHCLKGNHEQIMLDILDGDETMVVSWLEFGGREALLSWKMDIELIHGVESGKLDPILLVEAFRSLISPNVVEWMRGLPSFHQEGDYLFVHAGVRPKAGLDIQGDQEFLWIREPFLSSRYAHPWRVVHGHTQTQEVEMLSNRIGIDTGAYRTGILTAVGIQDDECWSIQTDPPQMI